MDPRVALRACPTYDREAVEAAVRTCLDALGGLESLVRPGSRVFCKVNLLVPAAPERAISTHPEVVRAVVREIRRLGGVPLVGDSPAIAATRTALRKSGILAVVEDEKVEVPDLEPVVRLENPDGRCFRHFEVSKAIAECDVIFNLPKLKTHGLTYMTCATKNLFGLVPGAEKARWHLKAPTPEEFAVLVCDLYGAVLRRFDGGRRLVHLLDGILAMEGEGPGTGGRARPLGALLASYDATALDRVACAIAGLGFDRLVVVHEAIARGMGEGRLDRIPVVGDPLDRWADVRFVPPPGSAAASGPVTRLMRNSWVRNRLLERPILMVAKCSGCLRCENICPAKAITSSGKPPRPAIDLKKCIRCYCCAEVCPDAAMRKSRTPLLGRLARAL
jgi:uncharacterized protein (DUF362 family)/Pyruvate/2-oxoacid:ferredoxin oxidoreductase delta subunit